MQEEKVMGLIQQCQARTEELTLECQAPVLDVKVESVTHPSVVVLP
jgi:hypothetical protein